MICGIDETGDFDPTSNLVNYFVAVHIDQNLNKYEIKRSQFNIWEGAIPHEFKTEDGEVKGKKLTDKYLESFYSEILDTKPSILYSVVRIVPKENPIEVIEKHKLHEINAIEKVIEEATKQGHEGWVKGYKQILYWYKNKNYQTVLKMKCLEELLGISLNNMIGWAQITYILDNEDLKNLRDIQFKIDKDFIRADNVKVLWNEIFRQFWQQFTKKDPLPIMTAWKKEDHPFFKIYHGNMGQANMKKIFRNNTHFLESHVTWEIRIADIVGTILHRYQNRGRCKEIGEKLLTHLGKKQQNYRHLILNNV